MKRPVHSPVLTELGRWGGLWAHTKDNETMALIPIKIALLAGLAILTLGVFPDRLRGGIIAIATGIAAAFVLHFVAP
jgi:hypothetical protein